VGGNSSCARRSEGRDRVVTVAPPGAARSEPGTPQRHSRVNVPMASTLRCAGATLQTALLLAIRKHRPPKRFDSPPANPLLCLHLERGRLVAPSVLFQRPERWHLGPAVGPLPVRYDNVQQHPERLYAH
jgi:hypothetical protein